MSGLGLVIASACVFNNIIDRNIDKVMARTKQRALASGLISLPKAYIYATVLGLVGSIVLLAYTNFLTLIIALIGMFFYDILYGLAKRGSVHSTLVGSVSGSVPIVVGYVAVTDQFDSAALLLFLILALWQMPHFYAIALYRLRDYKAAKLPVLPAVKGSRITKLQIMIYIIAFALANFLLFSFGYVGITYVAIMLTVALVWFTKGLSIYKVQDSSIWGRKMFLSSLVVILTLSVMLSLNHWLP